MQTIQNKEQFRQDLLSWYEREHRDLPWRKTSNPYYIWVSEVMLQQTRVDTVIPYYERFIEAFPTLEALAFAEEQDVLKLWEGLGYYSRARNLQTGARQVVEQFNGIVPNDRARISTLRGVGPYTAGAVLSIAYGIPEHAVDGNVMRVFSRLQRIEADIARAKNKKIFEEAVMDVISHEDPSSFNQAIMELGAVVCTPKNPHCFLCPVQSHCAAYEAGVQEQLPVKVKKTKVKRVTVVPYVFIDEAGHVLVRQRPEKGLLSNLWEFPYEEATKDNLDMMDRLIFDRYGVEVEGEPIEYEPYEHVFSHLRWFIYPKVVRVKGKLTRPEGYRVVDYATLQQLPKPVPVLRLIEQLETNELFST